MVQSLLKSSLCWTVMVHVEAHAKNHPACLQGALGVLGVEGFAVDSATLPHQKSMDVLRSQGWVSRGRFLAVGPPL
eukprot:9487153-Pyramimonas_sp.AAC.1